jgi:glycine betaine/proline transport system ATP-binding protein
MDEAFSALDPLIRSQMQDQLIELQSELGKTVVFITHDLDEALRIGDHIAILKDGALSQVGTPPEILLDPADDYVADFVRDVNRARVLTVDVVMRPPKARIAHENIERALREMRDMGEKWGYVVKDRRYCGVTSEGSLEKAVADSDARNLYEIAEAGPTLTANDALETALPAALETDYPLPVVDEDGNLMGVVSSREMSSVLSPPKAPAAAPTVGRSGGRGDEIAPPPPVEAETVDPPHPGRPRAETEKVS